MKVVFNAQRSERATLRQKYQETWHAVSVSARAKTLAMELTNQTIGRYFFTSIFASGFFTPAYFTRVKKRFEGSFVNPLALAALEPLMALTRGISDVVIGLLDGPVAVDHPAFERNNIHEHPQREPGIDRSSAACMHGTFIAGMLCARRNTDAPALCPGCILLVRPVFGAGDSPGIPAGKLAAAMVEAIDAGARVINLSLAHSRPSPLRQCELEAALDYAARRNVLVVAAAGNQGALGSSALTRHPWVIPVAACDSNGMPLAISNFGPALGRRGLSAPGDAIISLAPGGDLRSFSGTSVAVPFVSGTIALLWSLFPNASAAQIKHVLIHASAPRGATLFPPLLNAARAYRALAATRSGARCAAALMQ